jgi:hypothetical protein
MPARHLSLSKAYEERGEREGARQRGRRAERECGRTALLIPVLGMLADTIATGTPLNPES